MYRVSFDFSFTEGSATDLNCYMLPTNLFAAIDFNNFILIDVFENVRRIHENANGAGCGNNEEYIKLQAIDDHRDIFPIFASLKPKHIRSIN